jgi:hypothetical protein
MANIPGTTIPESALNGMPSGKKTELLERLAADIEAGDSRGANDALFSIAFWTKKDPETGEWGRGQGNPNVSKVHSGAWEVTADMDSDASWAEQHINSTNDVYVQAPGSKADTGGGTDSEADVAARAVTWGDDGGVFVAGESTGSWGGLAHTEQGEGSKYFDPAYSGGGIGDPGGINKPAVGVEGGVPIDPVISGGYTIDDLGGLLGGGGGGGGGTDFKVPAGSVDMLAYRPGSRPYWDRYLGKDIRKGLMDFQLPKTYQTSLGYLPGEIRDPENWAKYQGMGGSRVVDGKVIWDLPTGLRSNQFQGLVPQGTWRTNPATYPGLQAGSSNRQPGWQFAAAPSQMVNMPDWTPYNISPTEAGKWKGLLGDWAAPKLNTTNLLGADNGAQRVVIKN